MERILGYPSARECHYASIGAKNMRRILEASTEILEGLGPSNGDKYRDHLFRLTERRMFSGTIDGDEEVTFADLLQHYDRAAVRDGIEEYVDSLVIAAMEGKAAESHELAANGIGLVVVRPEMLHARRDVLAFLEANDIDTLAAREVELTPEQYVALYSHAFTDADKCHHVRRRALGYVGHELTALIIRHRDPRLQYSGFMEYFTKELKGTAGKQDPQTLRGGVVYDALADVQEEHNIAARLALDPFGLYDRAGEGNEYAEGVNRYLANLPGVHVPDGAEIVKDFCVLSGSMTVPEFIAGAERSATSRYL